MKLNTSFLRKRVYFKFGPREEILSGVVTKHIPFKRHPTDHTLNELEQLRVKVESRPKNTSHGLRWHTAPIGDFTIEVPEKQIPKVWRDILDAQPKAVRAYLGVCLLPHHSPIPTTLFHLVTLQTLRVEVVSSEYGDVKLWPNEEQPTEGKLNMDDGDTVFKVGDLVIEMEADSY